MIRSRPMWAKTLSLALAGALAFWLANLAISLTPVAADYRAGLSIAYVPMLIEALFGGLVIGLCVSYALVRFFSAIPTHSAVMKALVLCAMALVVSTVLIEVPSKLLGPAADASRYLMLATLFNIVRIGALGVVIGLLYDRLD